ncbi:MAG: HD domain-containing protein [Lachnospiraceae bacterium]|nr:HD domain-containing protein [Lachnospiraceae bacterium]
MKTENVEFEELVRIVSEDPKCQEMKKYVQHSDVTTFDHCMDVAKHSFYFVRRFHIRCDEKALVVGAFLHDYYLYDWHTYGDHLHGYHHADRALLNALRDFEIDEKVQGIIKTHMWPLNLTRVPGSREALVVCMIDKIVSAKETLNRPKEVKK